jgi:hypothetical protein
LPGSATDEEQGTYFQLAIALSAFLLFVVQPVIAKHLAVVWRSASVWNPCLLFFQFLLLLGAMCMRMP